MKKGLYIWCRDALTGVGGNFIMKIEGIKKIKARVRPKLKYVQYRVSIEGTQYDFSANVLKTAVNPNNLDIQEEPSHKVSAHFID